MRSRAHSRAHTHFFLTTVPPLPAYPSPQSSYPSLATPRAALGACSRVAVCPLGADEGAGLAREVPRAAPVRGAAPRGRVQVGRARRVEHPHQGPRHEGPPSSPRRGRGARCCGRAAGGSRRAARGCGSARAAGGGAPRVCRGCAQRGRRPPPSASLRRPGVSGGSSRCRVSRRARVCLSPAK